MKGKLTAKQAVFVQEYLIDLNATQAAIRAGYSKRSAQQTGFDNLLKPLVSAAIQAKADERAKRTEIDADWVLKMSKELTERCMQHEPVYDSDGNETGEYKFDSAGAVRGIKLVGDHVTVKAFDKTVQHEASDSLLDFLSKIPSTTGPPSER